MSNVIELSQQDYQETPYEDATWEVVGEVSSNEEFLPLEVTKVEADFVARDPMFADYGGMEQKDALKRWHLPDHLAEKAAKELEHGEVPQIPTTSLTDAEIEAIKKAAYDQGKAEALAQAAEEATEKLGSIEGKLRGVFNDIQAQFKNNLEIVEKQAVLFSIEVARKLIDSAVEINPEYITEIVKKAILNSGSAKIRSIRVSPQDLEFIDLVGIRRQLKEFDGTWEFISDSTVKSGCIVETSAGEIDYRLEEAWERIKDSVVKVLR